MKSSNQGVEHSGLCNDHAAPRCKYGMWDARMEAEFRQHPPEPFAIDVALNQELRQTYQVRAIERGPPQCCEVIGDEPRAVRHDGARLIHALVRVREVWLNSKRNWRRCRPRPAPDQSCRLPPVLASARRDYPTGAGFTIERLRDRCRMASLAIRPAATDILFVRCNPSVSNR